MVKSSHFPHSIEELLRAKGVAKAAILPPVQSWNPPFCGDLDMRIGRDGLWYYLGTPIGRPELVRLFSSILRKEGEKYFLVTPVEKVGIIVDDVPFLAIDFEQEGDILTFETNVGDRVLAGKSCPIDVVLDSKTQEPCPYLLVRDNLYARIDRKSFYRLVEIGVEREHEGQSWFGLCSSGVFFPMMKSVDVF